MSEDITAELLLTAYRAGYFPMAESRDSPHLHWFYPERRGILPLETFHVPRRLARRLKQHPFTITTDRVFPQVIAACAEREETWINDRIIRLYGELWQQGYAHSVECWQDRQLVGGLYGVAIGGAFFGESMFSRLPDASKIALAHLVEMLKTAGYVLLDAQYVNDHLKQFGIVEIARAEYLEKLKAALAVTPRDCFRAR